MGGDPPAGSKGSVLIPLWGGAFTLSSFSPTAVSMEKETADKMETPKTVFLQEKIVTELIETERSYVKQLHALVNDFVIPLTQIAVKTKDKKVPSPCPCISCAPFPRS